MLDEEALWINFVATRPFAVKIYTGDVNAISGETTENERNGEAVLNRRKSALKNGRSLQDYVVAGSQKWLDGVYNHDGEVSQFVATPKGSGYCKSNPYTRISYLVTAISKVTRNVFHNMWEGGFPATIKLPGFSASYSPSFIHITDFLGSREQSSERI